MQVTVKNYIKEHVHFIGSEKEMKYSYIKIKMRDGVYTINERDGVLEITADHGSLIITPKASNNVKIKQEH